MMQNYNKLKDIQYMALIIKFEGKYLTGLD